MCNLPHQGGKPRNTLDQHVEAIHLLASQKHKFLRVFPKMEDTPKWMVYDS